MKKRIFRLLLKHFILLILCILAVQCSCQKKNTSNNTNTNPPSTSDTTTFAKGADISWLPQMEASNYVFLNNNSVAQDVIDILKSKGVNSIRLRVFVNPSTDARSGYCSKKDVAKMAQRVKAKGLKLMIDFHYSDSWADPGKQNKPTAWSSYTFDQLKQAVYDHTYEVLDTLKQLAIIPEWVQVGNEITSGMLWPDGKVSSTTNWSNLAQLINKGYEATKAIDTSIKVIVHIDKGNNSTQATWFFGNLTAQNAKFDIIGFSYYPYWLSPEGFKDYKLSINDLKNNLNDVVTKYKKPVMIVEIGEIDNQPDAAYNMLVDVINMVKNIPNGQGLGVLYWEPQGARSWSNYNLSAWDNTTGKPTKALDAFNLN